MSHILSIALLVLCVLLLIAHFLAVKSQTNKNG